LPAAPEIGPARHGHTCGWVGWRSSTTTSPARVSTCNARWPCTVALAHENGDGWGEGYAYVMLGLALAEGGDLRRAGTHFRAALAVASLGPILGVPLQGLARALVAGDPARAIRLLGAAAAHFDRTGTLQPGFVQRRADATYDRGVQLLGAGAAARAFDDGRRMSTDEAIGFALSGPVETPRPAPGGLTRRETQVAALVARGLANRDIAATLFISVRTVQSHVDHILTKLALHNRTQLAAWVRDHGLAVPSGIR
jgi:DNA-binding CsgD family transcriptional regulator